MTSPVGPNSLSAASPNPSISSAMMASCPKARRGEAPDQPALPLGAIFGGEIGTDGLEAEWHERSSKIGGGDDDEVFAEHRLAPEAGNGRLSREHQPGAQNTCQKDQRRLRRQFASKNFNLALLIGTGHVVAQPIDEALGLLQPVAGRVGGSAEHQRHWIGGDSCRSGEPA